VRAISSAFDTYAYLVGPTGSLLAQDDNGWGGTDSLIRQTAQPAGSYTIEVTSRVANVTGAFTLIVTPANIATGPTVGVEWVNDYHDPQHNLMYHGSADGLYSVLTSNGVLGLFNNGDDNAQESHWRDAGFSVGGNPGQDHEFIERTDLSLFQGHGNTWGSSGAYYGVFEFGNSLDKTIADSREMRLGEMGKLKWLAFDSCLQLQVDDDRGYNAWRNSFKGLHMILGFRTESSNHPYLFSDNGVGSDFAQKLVNGQTVSSAWLDAGQTRWTWLLNLFPGSDIQKPAVMSAESSSGATATLDNDHFTGFGTVVPSIANPSSFMLRYIE
jgi:hypothetical protein